MPDKEQPAELGDLVSFLRDEPADEDFFQTHSRLAKAIAAAIRSDSDLRVIGLLGRWGSGKSTVIRYLRDQLREGEVADDGRAVHVFTYDAWLHQKDPVRRSFLESLLTYLIDEKLTSREMWNEKLLELTGHVEKTNVTQTPVLSDDAKWILVSLLPVPIAIGLIDIQTIQGAWGETPTSLAIVTFWSALALLAIPVAVTIGRYWRNRRRSKSTGETASLLPILINRSIQRTESITQRSPDPTSIEFGNTFREIMADATKAGAKFVFVIDNLDRVAESEALQIWATIRSFFLKTSENEPATKSSATPVVVLPVDTHALERMFALSENKIAAKELARSFVNKTFDITFHLSEPVMSDWRDFLDQQLRKVFGGSLDKTQVFWTRHFFEASLPSSKMRVTPREVNKLVNRLAALYLQWRSEDIKFEVLAYYAVRGEGAATDILEFISEPANDIERVADGWKLQFAALHYGVVPDKAAQVLIEEPLRAAITERDERRFAELSEIPGFGVTFEHLTSSSALNDSDGTPSFELITNAALLLSTLKASEAYWMRQSWRNLIDSYFDTEGLGEVRADLDQRIAVFFSQLESQEEKQILIDGSAHEISAALSAGADGTAMEPLRTTAKSLLQFALGAGLKPPSFNVEAEPRALISILSSWSSDRETWKQIRTETSPAALVQALAQALQTSPDFIVVPQAVAVLRSYKAGDFFDPPAELEWSPLVEVAANLIRQQTVPAATPAAVNALGFLLATDSTAKAALEALLNEGQLQGRLTAAADDKDLQCSLVALLIWSGRDFAAPSGLSWEDVVKQDRFLATLYARLRSFVGNATMKFIWTSQKNATSARGLLDALIRHAIETGDLGTIPLIDILSDPDAYLYVVPYRLRQRFMWLLESYDRFWLRLEQAPLNDGLAEAARLMSQKGDEQAAKVVELLKVRLEDVTSDSWNSSLEEASQPLKIALEFFPSGELKLGVRSGLHAALWEQIGALLASSDRAFRKRWFDAAGLLAQHAQKKLYDGLCTALIAGPNVTNLNALFQVSGDNLSKNKCFAAHPDEAIRNIVLKQMRTREGRTWLRNRGEDVRTWLRHSKPETKRQLSAALSSFESGKVEERKYWAEVIRGEWKLKK